MGIRWNAAVRSSFHLWMLAAWCGAGMLVSSAQAADEVSLPDNLARSALAAATSEHNASYLAKFATDGKIPPPGSTSEDLSAAWCVLKAKTGDAADFTLDWDQPVDVAEIVYFGRTSWFMEECFKDYEVYLDDAAQPAAKGTLQMIHGPQRIAIPPAKAQKITIKFLNSYGGFNPGAAEIMVFGQELSRKQAALLHRLSGVVEIAGVDQVAPDALRELIQWMQKTHGPAYPQADGHLARLAALGQRDDDEAQQELARLQRDVLLFDVDRVAGDQAARDHGLARLHVSLRRPAERRRAVRRPAARTGRAAGRIGRLAGRPDPGLRPVLRRHAGPVQLAAEDGRRVSPVDGQHRRQRPAAADRRPVARLQRLLAARRRHRFSQHARAAVRLLLARAGRRPAPHGRRRLERGAAVGQLPERLHALPCWRTGGSSTRGGNTWIGRRFRSRACGRSTRTARDWPATSATACCRRARSWKPGRFPARRRSSAP